MNRGIFQWRSLKTRVTLFTLAIFVISIWSLTFYTTRMLHKDMQRLLGEQQFSTVSLTAMETNHELDDWLGTLKTVGASVTPAILGNPAAMQAFLEQYPIIQNSFNAGVIAYRLDGTAVAEVPLSGGRVGVNYMDRDFVTAALKEGKPTIGKPHRSKQLGNPEFGIAVPIRDAQGKVIGALGGEINLDKPNALDAITQGHYGKTGGYSLVAPQYRLIVTATDKSRVMETLPAPGIVAQLDRFIQGYEGSAVYVSSQGEEVLASAKGVPAAGWYVAAALPTAEAFAPIHDMQQRMLLTTILLTLLAGGLTWWILRRQLAPMMAAVETLATLSNTDQPPQPLPITRRDEIGQLIGSFNNLLETLGQREAALRTREERFQALFDRASEGILIVSASGKLVAANESFARMHGYTAHEIRGMSLSDLDTPENQQRLPERMQRILAGEFTTFEVEHYHKDGHVFPLEVSASLIHTDGEPLVQAFHRDITERKQAAVELRALSAQLTMTEERERQILAQELHDNLGQILAVIKIKLTSLAAGDLQPSVNQIVELVDQADQSARLITRQLSPPILRTLGLASALDWLAEEMERLHRLTVHINRDGCTRPLVEGVQAVLYRSARELLINVAKHAGVGAANLDFMCDENRLMLIVSDAGGGFDAAAFHNASPGQRSFGLSSIHERITNIGGKMDIGSRPGHGTTITLILPCAIAMKEPAAS
jgi:PAS domain S-box-containing protein